MIYSLTENTEREITKMYHGETEILAVYHGNTLIKDFRNFQVNSNLASSITGRFQGSDNDSTWVGFSFSESISKISSSNFYENPSYYESGFPSRYVHVSFINIGTLTKDYILFANPLINLPNNLPTTVRVKFSSSFGDAFSGFGKMAWSYVNEPETVFNPSKSIAWDKQPFLISNGSNNLNNMFIRFEFDSSVGFRLFNVLPALRI
jgi:hypothetical protein